MALAHRFGAKWIISSTGEAHFGKDERITDDVLIENIKALLPDLEKYGMKLGIEVHGEYGTGEKILNIVKGVGSDLRRHQLRHRQRGVLRRQEARRGNQDLL